MKRYSQIFIFVSSFGFIAALMVNLLAGRLFNDIPGVSSSLLYAIGGGPLVTGSVIGSFYMFYGSALGSIIWLAIKIFKNRESFDKKLEQLGDRKITLIAFSLIVFPILLGITMLISSELATSDSTFYIFIAVAMSSALLSIILMMLCRHRGTPVSQAAASFFAAVAWCIIGIGITIFLIIPITQPELVTARWSDIVFGLKITIIHNLPSFLAAVIIFLLAKSEQNGKLYSQLIILILLAVPTAILLADWMEILGLRPPSSGINALFFLNLLGTPIMLLNLLITIAVKPKKPYMDFGTIALAGSTLSLFFSFWFFATYWAA